MQFKKLQQTVANPFGMCECVIERGAINALASILPANTGKPGRALVVADDVSLPVVDEVRKTCISTGYETHVATAEAPATLASTYKLAEELARVGFTKDDALVGVGAEDVLTTCVYAAGLWRGGIPCAVVPTTLTLLLQVPSRPQALLVEGVRAARPPFRVDACLVDSDYLTFSPADAQYVSVFATKVAVCESKDAMCEVDRVLAQMRSLERKSGGENRAPEKTAPFAPERAPLFELAILSARWAGRIASATSVQAQAGLAYGTEFAEVLSTLLPQLGRAQALAEGVRFTSRVAVSAVDASLELVQEQDRLLEVAGVPPICANVDAHELYDALLQCVYAKERRLMFAMPYAPGRVRLLPVAKELLKEHVDAWTESRKQKAGKT